MSKKESSSIKQDLAVISTKIDSMGKLLDEHVKSSDKFREEVAEHRESLEWLKKSNYGIIGFIVALIVTVVGFFLTK